MCVCVLGREGVITKGGYLSDLDLFAVLITVVQLAELFCVII